MSDQGSTPSSPPESGTLADQGVGTTQVIDLADIDLSGALPEEKKIVPPPLPPEEIARASQPPRSTAPASMPPTSLAPAGPAGRSTRFYVTVLVASLVAFVAVGALIARSMRTAPPAAGAAPAASGTPAAGRVITINPVEMTDDVDAAAK